MPKLPGLRRAREKAVLTQDELAARAQIARSTITHLERLEAVARPATIRKLAAALGCEPQTLLSES